MTSPHTLLVTHAHPDDEVFGTGGILAKYAEAGARVVVVYCTRGEAGEIHDPDLDPAEAAIRLGEIREQEVREAALLLGVQEIHFLGYRDSGMIDTDDGVIESMPALFSVYSLPALSPRITLPFSVRGTPTRVRPSFISTR